MYNFTFVWIGRHTVTVVMFVPKPWTRVSSCYLLCLSIECSLPQAKGRGAEKNMALGARFQKLTLLSGGAGFSEGQGGAKFSERVRFWKATMFFCKRVICVALL